MNKKQKICLRVGIAVVVVAALLETSLTLGIEWGFLNVYHKFVYSWGRLLVWWILTGLVISLLIVTFKDRKPKDEQKQ